MSDVYGFRGPARRRMKCRHCGKEIARGEKYWVYSYLDGPYLRREAVCHNCARKGIAQILRYKFLNAYEWELKQARARRVTVIEGLALDIAKRLGYKEKFTIEEKLEALDRALRYALQTGEAKQLVKHHGFTENMIRRWLMDEVWGERNESGGEAQGG